MDEALPSAVQTLHRPWAAFPGHLPFLLAGLVVLATTWAASAALQALLRRTMQRWHWGSSLKAAAQRLIGIAVWSIGLPVTAMIARPGLTPTRALGGLGLVLVALGLAFKGPVPVDATAADD